MAKKIYRVTFKEKFNKQFIEEFENEKAFEQFLMLNYSTKRQLNESIVCHPETKRTDKWNTVMPYIFQRDDNRFKKELFNCLIEVACNYTVHNEKDAEHVAKQIAKIFGKNFEECKVQKCYWNDVIFFNADCSTISITN